MQRAEQLAFLALIEAKLEPASTYTTWCEGESYGRHTRAAYGAGLPFPLSFWLPWSQRRAALRRFATSSREKVAPALSHAPYDVGNSADPRYALSSPRSIITART